MLRSGLLAALVGVAACATPTALPPDRSAGLFAQGLDEIGALYIRPVSSHSLAVAGLGRLHGLDPALQVTETPGTASEVLLLAGGREAARYPAPAGTDPVGWGKLIGHVLDRARQVSPRLAALSEDRADKAVFDGITAALDRFSRYSAPTAARAQRAARDGFGGIGAIFVPGGLRVAAVAAGGPAALAGMAPGDEIVAIDGRSTLGRPPAAVMREIGGPVHSPIEITVRRGTPGVLHVLPMRRALIVVPTVTESEAGGIAVLRVAIFNRDTAQELAERLKAAERANGGPLRGIVLDLRGDPGGLLDQAVAVGDLFIGKGPIASTIGRNPASRQYFAASGRGIALHVPIVVLINGASASSSEIVAAALQDTGRAVVVGSASFGKGTVQTVLRLPNGGELILTWALLVTPSGYLLNRRGVVPTVCTDPGAGDAKPPPGPLAARPRAALDDATWAALRRGCPGRTSEDPADLEIAERLLADPARYREALHAIAAGPQLGERPAPPAPGLTPAGPALSSGGSAH